MKKIIAILLALVTVLLCSCGKKEKTSTTSSEEPEAPSFDISTVNVAELPTEILAADLSTWSNINLIAELPEEKVMLYGLSVTDDGRGVIFRKDDDIYYYDWAWFTTKAKLPEIAAMDIDGDKSDEIAISMYVDYNTDVSVEELHIIDLDGDTPEDYCYTTDEFCADFEDKFDIRYETDEKPEEETSSESKKDKDDKDDTTSKTWLIDHSADIGKRIIFEQKADEVKEGKDPKKYFTYDATRDVRDNGEYNGIVGYDQNVDYTFNKGAITIKLRVAAKFADSSDIKFICSATAPVTVKDGEFVMGDIKFSKSV